jgi:hypothetical protein
MFHYIRHIHFCSIDSCLGQRLIQQFSRRPDKRMTSPILLIAGLFADEHDPGVGCSFAENCLRRILPEVTGLAACGGLP